MAKIYTTVQGDMWDSIAFAQDRKSTRLNSSHMA